MLLLLAMVLVVVIVVVVTNCVTCGGYCGGGGGGGGGGGVAAIGSECSPCCRVDVCVLACVSCGCRHLCDPFTPAFSGLFVLVLLLFQRL